jgi:hypothetical protein
MRLALASRRLVTLLTACAVLFGSLVPLFSIASERPLMTEICSVDGTRLILSTDAHAAGEEGSSKAHALEHCAWCFTHMSTSDLPPVGIVVLPVPGLSDAPAPAFLSAPRTLHAWVSAQPRAPPPRS